MATSTIGGTAQKGKKTKDLVKRLTASDIAVIDHVDIDRVSAEGLVASGVKGVVNAAKSISGRYPNIGPQILVDAGIQLLDEVGAEVFDIVQDGDELGIHGNDLYCNHVLVASGINLDAALVEFYMDTADQQIDAELELFVKNTAEYLEKQKGSFIYDPWIPPLTTEIRHRQVLVVVRGYDYLQDLKTLTSYIREVKPVLIGVDGGADALLEAGFTPDIIIGDMDSVTDKALLCGAEVIPHAYDDGTCPSLERVQKLGLTVTPWPLSATSEDLALLLAWEKKADLIVALGTHSNLVEYLDKGRSGMASSFLVRLKVGTKLVDAKGVSKLYRATPPPRYILLTVLAALVALIAAIAISPPLRQVFIIMWLNIRTHLGI
ncbi:MAG: hypothetical protein LBU48_02730 [Coriobacteriales bacterium]|jgi:uncharacterized membrane-anchored protein|nr:hypothetical protein [Coriobacteriales bacterium]